MCWRLLEAYLLQLHLSRCSIIGRTAVHPRIRSDRRRWPTTTVPAYFVANDCANAVFLVIINFVYGLFDTFAIIDATTRGGPAGATSILVYKVYRDGFVNLDMGSSAAQSVILMITALALTFAQFRLVERRVNYAV